MDRAGRGRLALTGADRREFLHGQITNDIEALEPGHGRYAALLTHKGKMLGDLRVLDLGDELLLSCERAGLQELFNMIRRYKLGSDVELHKRTIGDGRAVADRPRGAARRGRRGARPRGARQPARGRSAGSRSCSSPPTSAWTSSAPPRRPRPCARR